MTVVTPEFLVDMKTDGLFEDEVGEFEELGCFALFDLSHEEDISLEPWAILRVNEIREPEVVIAGDRAAVMRKWREIAENYDEFYSNEIPSLL